MPGKLRPWTTTLRDTQPEDAFCAVYKVGAKRLVFIAAQHDNRDDSATFRMIRAAYAGFRFDTVVAEGWPTSLGKNPPSIFKYVAANGASKDGFVEGGETIPTVVGAHEQGAGLIGGEAGDPDIKAKVLADGFAAADLLGFYVLRIVPQWIAERKAADAADPRLQPLIAAALDRNCANLQLPESTLPGFAEWAAWYRAQNHKPFGTSFDPEETGPLSDGRFGTNRIAHAVSRARDTYLHGLIVARLNAGETVLVVFGGSHLMIHRPALDAVLGMPCYAGKEMERAVVSCR